MAGGYSIKDLRKFQPGGLLLYLILFLVSEHKL